MNKNWYGDGGSGRNPRGIGEKPRPRFGGCSRGYSSHPSSLHPPLWSRRASWFGEVQVRRGQRRRRQKDAVEGEATGGVLSSPPAGRAAPESPAHLRAWGFLGLGPRDDAGIRSRRCTAGREGRGLGREEKVDLSLEGILLTIFFPLPRGCLCFPTPLSRLCGPVLPALPQHPPDGTGRLDSAPLGVALGQRKELGKIRKVKS